MNKRKIFNDPVYGFITIPSAIIFDLIEHPFFQRLRRIQQLGLTHYIYPGAQHTRFQHALGALHLMMQALAVLKSKGHKISKDEQEAACIAILLHDIGHGPYSHTLERSLITGVSHEGLSLLIMQKLNDEFGGKLSMAIDIFSGKYPKQFLHQLVSGQLDMDRMDYLNRDSFFTGVYEGVIGYDRIIKMLEIHNGNLVVESKGIYSIEKFIIARRLMYWQVYLHKTVLVAEQMLWKALLRAREVISEGKHLFASPALIYFLMNELSERDFKEKPEALEFFMSLDDFDIFAALKVWSNQGDKVLSQLCKRIVNRQLLKVTIQNEPFGKAEINKIKQWVMKQYEISESEAGYIVFTDSTSNSAYSRDIDSINILYKDGSIKDIADASDQLNISVLSHPVVKYYLCYPKVYS